MGWVITFFTLLLIFDDVFGFDEGEEEEEEKLRLHL